MASFFSSLDIHEQCYSIRAHELLEVAQVLRHWRCFPHSRFYEVHTDHESLRYLKAQETVNDRQVKRLNLLEQLDFNIILMKGTSNPVALALPSNPQGAPKKHAPNQDLHSHKLTKTRKRLPKKSEVKNPMATSHSDQDLAT